MKNLDSPMETFGNKPEVEQLPRYRLMVSRHAERLPDGSLSPEGVESSKKKGKKLKEEAEVVKGYASDEKSGRTVMTSDIISDASETTSASTKEGYRTRKVEDIQYEILNPDLIHLIGQAKEIIDEATIKELGLPENTILANLPKKEQEKIAPIRQKNQELGLKLLLNYPEGVHRMSIGLAHQLAKELKLVDRYDDLRKNEKKPIEKDVILNTVSHAMFSESLFIEAGYIKTEDSGLKKIDKSDIENPKFGGFIMPSESFFLEIKDPKNIPDKIPVSFEKEGRPEEGAVFIDKNRLLELAEEYEEWRNKS